MTQPGDAFIGLRFYYNVIFVLCPMDPEMSYSSLSKTILRHQAFLPLLQVPHHHQPTLSTNVLPCNSQSVSR